MDALWLEPWMLWQDWRTVTATHLCVDLDQWPDDQPFDPRPPLPMIGTGRADHPQACQMDALASDTIPLDSLTCAITGNPRTSAILVQLLRSLEELPLDAALTVESLAFATLQSGSEHQAWLAKKGPMATVAPGDVRVERTDATLNITLDRPHALNAIDRAMRDALFEAFSLAAMDTSIARVLLRGAGRAFSMGADLSEFGSVSDPATAHAIRMLTLPARALLRRPDCVEAHVQGGCVGAGLEIAAFAARLTASPHAWFQLPELAMGIIPGAGGCVSLLRRIGRQRTAALILAGKRIKASVALDWGLIDAIVNNLPAKEG